MPVAGGESIYAFRLFGTNAGFLVGWFVTLYLLAVTAFEAIALPWMLQTLFPVLRGPVLYTVFGETVTVDAVLFGVAGVALITFLNYRDVRLAVAFQTIVTYGFLAVALLIIVLGAATGSAANARPMFASGSEMPWWLGTFWSFSNCAFFLNGFQAIPQTIEERVEGISSGGIARVMVGSVVAATLFYCPVPRIEIWNIAATSNIAFMLQFERRV